MATNPTNFAPWLQISGVTITGEMSFSEAADEWIASLASRGAARRIRPSTEYGYRQQLTTLKLFFGKMRLSDIRPDHFRNYENARVQGAAPFIRRRRPHAEPGPCPAGPKKANAEISLLKRLLRLAKLWTEEQDWYYTPLAEEPSDSQRALTRTEQDTWLKVSRSRERWHLVHVYSLLAFATCMSTNELRSLRFADVNLEAGTLNIPWAGAKNKFRHRSVTIGSQEDEAYRAVQWLMNRAHGLGAVKPEHFLFPFRRPPLAWDPRRPMTSSGLKRLWEEVRLASGLTWFRQYDTRHTAITRLAEEGVPMATIMSMAGHVSAKMSEHYTHISGGLKLQAMRQVQRNLTNGIETGPQIARPSSSLPESKPSSVRQAPEAGVPFSIVSQSSYFCF